MSTVQGVAGGREGKRAWTEGGSIGETMLVCDIKNDAALHRRRATGRSRRSLRRRGGTRRWTAGVELFAALTGQTWKIRLWESHPPTIRHPTSILMTV